MESANKSGCRPPAVPLITHDPYFSVWSGGDQLTDVTATHWTGTWNQLYGVVRIDGKNYRFIGERLIDFPVMRQTALEVRPTSTIYQFEAAGIQLTLTFTSPLLADDLDLLSRPVTYVTWDVQACDGKTHDVSVYIGVLDILAVNERHDQVQWSRYQLDGLSVLSAAAADQRMLARSGDNLRIEWGTLFVAAPKENTQQWAGEQHVSLQQFLATGSLPVSDDLDMPRRADDRWPGLMTVCTMGAIGSEPVSQHLMIAYDDRFSIVYLERKLRPYWRRNGATANDLLTMAATEYASIVDRCRRFDDEFLCDLRQAGGEQYAQLCALAYRQAIAAHKLCVDLDGTPLFFSKENFSNGCIATVDVTYPSSPLFLLVNPELLKGMTTPILDYASLPRWRFPFAPHDLGTYPLANGQVYGGGERGEENQMPVEESGNMLLLVAALAKAEGHTDYARRYWPLLSQWANYLREKGLNPENQLCTDDFAGHLAGNTNLSIKAICALGAYAWLAEQLGEQETADTYRQAAEEMAKMWQQMAADGDHFRLVFDHADTWSQKYNLVWDRLLDLRLFPAEVAQKEIAYYKTVQQEFGLPLDSRKTYTKLDWIVWSATLAEDEEDFRALVEPLSTWMNTTSSRVPLTDWYDTVTGKQVGFQARSVVGGLFIKLLYDDAIWHKWVARAQHPETVAIS
ncbi:MAG TPA: DUF4965 domain-containing protein [Armatimonadota bacterium]|nr:DUF4965 domain-containing protein [Armatimonadota bacterium]